MFFLNSLQVLFNNIDNKALSIFVALKVRKKFDYINIKALHIFVFKIIKKIYKRRTTKINGTRLKELKSITGIKQVTMTTNGILLPRARFHAC